MSWTSKLGRRDFLKATALTGAAIAMPGLTGRALAAEPINFATWSAAVDTVKSHIAAFEAKTGVKVNYSNSPWAQYRESTITKFIGKAPVDVLWVSDSWLPEWVEAGWLAPVDQYKSLTDNADVDQFCVNSMTYKGKQYGNTYYSDYMAFIYNADMLAKAGIKAPPQSWAEVVEQSKIIKDKGLAQWPVLISMAQESWLIEFMSAMVFSSGGRFTDDKGDAVMQDPANGAAPALRWLVDAVQKHKILSPSCVETGELAVLKAFSSGEHAFGLIPEIPPADLERSRAKQARRQCKDRHDAEGRQWLKRDCWLDAVLRHDAPGTGGQGAGREFGQTDGVVRRQGRRRIQIPEATLQGYRRGLRRQVAVQ